MIIISGPQTSNFSTSQSPVYATIAYYEVPVRSFVEPTPYVRHTKYTQNKDHDIVTFLQELPVPLTSQQKKTFGASPQEEVELHGNVCYSSAMDNNDEQVHVHQNVCYSSARNNNDEQVHVHQNVCYSSAMNNNDKEVQVHQNVCYSGPREIDKEVKIQRNVCYSTHTSSTDDRYEIFINFLINFFNADPEMSTLKLCVENQEFAKKHCTAFSIMLLQMGILKHTACL